MGLWFLFYFLYFLYLLYFLYVLSFLHLRYNVLHGPSPRTGPHAPLSRRPPCRHRRSSLPRRQAPLPPRPPSRRYCPPWRAHHFLFPHRHMPPPQPWPFFPPLAFWTSPQITVSFPLLLLFPLPPLLHFLGVELRPNKILDSFFSRQSQTQQSAPHIRPLFPCIASKPKRKAVALHGRGKVTRG